MATLQGEHQRESHPSASQIYIAGLDLAGEAEVAEDALLRSIKPRQDSTVLTIGALDSRSGNMKIRVVEHYWWTGRKHAELYPQLVSLLKDIWGCRRIVVDATGVGQPVYSFLRKSLGSRVLPFNFTPSSKSELGFNLLATINSGSLKMYKGDGSTEYQEFWYEMEKAKSEYRPSRIMNFYVDPSDGHDDFLMSLALLAEAGRNYSPREARGSVAAV